MSLVLLLGEFIIFMIRITFLRIMLFAFPMLILAQPQIQSVVSAASFQPGLPAGGALATVFVSGSTTATPGTYVAPTSEPLPLSLGGVGISINGASAPILAVVIPAGQSSYTQINFQVPMERNVSSPNNNFVGTLSVSGSGGTATMAVPSLPEWGGFFSDANGYAVALHASDRSLVTTQSPAQPGEPIIAYADDFSRLIWPPPPIAIPVPPQPIFQFPALGPLGAPPNGLYLYLQTYPTSGPSFPTGSPTSCTNTPALQVTFEGLAANMVGVEEIDFVVPTNQTAGNWALFFNIGSNSNGSGCDGNIGSSSPYVLLPVG
jgi:uncharacterized protein (TIGR03437 family)